MKKNYILGITAIASLAFLSFQKTNTGVIESFKESHLFSGGGQAGFTGAPGEATCTGCHTGSTLDGSSENTFILLDGVNPVTNYTPGTSYTASLQLASNPAKKGFSAVALDGANNNVGSFTGLLIGGTQDFSASGKDYVSHTASSNTNANTAWLWTWDAPASDAGSVTFYIASNVSDDSGNALGDAIYLSQHIIGSTASISEEEAFNSDFIAGYSASNNSIELDFNSLSVGTMHMSLVDLNGRSVFNYTMGQSEIGENSESIVLPNELESGIYVVNFLVGNKAMSAKVMIQK